MCDLTFMTEDSQRTLAFLLMLPLGALITASINGVVGLRTIGIFSPTILALNQTRSDWRVGIIIFVITFALGSVGRKFLIRSKLSTITRRGVIATVTVTVFASMIVANENMQMGMKPGMVVLPVAILTLMIDRYFGIVEKEGNLAAMVILCNTILVTLCCFMVFEYTPAQKIFLKNPWLEVAVLCILIYIGSKVQKPFFTIPAKANQKDNKT